MSRRSKRLKRVSVPLDEEMLAVLEKLAQERDRSLAWMAAHAVRFYLAEVKISSPSALAFERDQGL
jgi:predicted transcriptional regulator